MQEAFVANEVKAVVDAWARKNPEIYLSLKRAANSRKPLLLLRWFWRFMAGDMYVKALDGLGSMVLSALAQEKGKELKDAGILTFKQGILIALTFCVPFVNGSWVAQGVGWLMMKAKLITPEQFQKSMKFLGLSAPGQGPMGMAEIYSLDEFRKNMKLIRRGHISSDDLSSILQKQGKLVRIGKNVAPSSGGSGVMLQFPARNEPMHNFVASHSHGMQKLKSESIALAVFAEMIEDTQSCGAKKKMSRFS